MRPRPVRFDGSERQAPVRGFEAASGHERRVGDPSRELASPGRAADLGRCGDALDLDIGAADRLLDRLGVLAGLAADDDLLDDADLLVDDSLFAVLAELERPLAERGRITGLDRTIDRVAIDGDPLLAQLDLLPHRGLGHVRVHADAAAVDRALADLELPLDDRD